MRAVFPNRADRYVARAVLVAVVLAMGVFSVLNLVFAVADELGGTQGAYGVWEALQYVLLTTPRRVLESLPYVALVGALAGLGQLATHAELVVLRAAGIAPGRIALAALLPTLPLMVLGLWLGETSVPVNEARAEAMKRSLRDSGPVVLPDDVSEGRWLRSGATWVRVAARDADGGEQLQGLSLYHMDAQGLGQVQRAARATWQAGMGWQLEDVSTASIGPRRLDLSSAALGRWETDAGPRVVLERLELQPDRLALTDLAFRASWLEAQDQDAGAYRLAFWQKLLQPLAVAALTLIGVSFVFGPLRETGMGTRLATGIAVGLAFKYLQDLLGPASVVFGFPPVLAVLLPVLLCAGIGAWLLRRAG